MKLPRFLPVLIWLCLPVAGLRAEDAAPAGDKDSPYEQIKTLTRAMELIRQDYVDGKKIGYEQLMRAALKGMLQSLDPHSQFMEPANFEDMKEDTESRFGGLGVHVTERNGDLIVVSPMEDSPGFRAGLLPGDKIIKIDGQSAERLDLNGAIEKLRGAPGTKVTLTILRPGTKEIKDFEMVRETIKVWSVKDAKLLPQEMTGQMKIGYARITQFNAPTAEELAKKLDELEKKGMQALVLDLRFNPGGLLSSAVDVAGMFLPPATVVATTEGRVAFAVAKIHREPRVAPACELSGGRAHQQRQRERQRDRRGRAQGHEPRDSRGRDDLWKRQRAEHHAAARWFRAAADDGEVLHAGSPGDPRARCRADDPRADVARTGKGAHYPAPRGSSG